MKFKRSLALLLSIILVFSVAPINIFAAGSGLKPGMEKAKVTFEYMEYTSEIDRSNAYGPNGLMMTGMQSNVPIVEKAALPEGGFNQNDYVMIGFTLSDMENIQESSYGLNTIKIVLQYDPNYLTPEQLTDSVNNFNFRMGMQNASRLTNQSYAHEILTPELSSLNPGWKAISLKLSVPNSVATPAYKGGSEDYIGFIEFQITGEPPENGAKVLELVDSSDQNIISFGQSGDYGSYEGLHPSGNTFDVIEFDDSVGRRIFPSTYTITYDANPTTEYDGAAFPNEVTAEQKQESVKEGEHPTFNNGSNDIASLLQPPADMVFDGWYTTSDNSGERVDIDPVTFTPTEDTTLYAHYANGYKATFNLNAGDDTTAKFEDGTTLDKYISAVDGDQLLKDGKTIAYHIGADPTSDNYKFDGWYTKNASGAFDTKYDDANLNNITTSTTLYAKWKDENPNNKTYKLNFDSNIDPAVTPAPTVDDADPNLVGYNTAGDTLDSIIGGLPIEPTRNDNYQFLGWYNNKYGDGTRLDHDTPLLGYTKADEAENNTTSVFAKWGYVEPPTPDNPIDPDNPDPTTNTVKVTFDKTGGSYAGGNYTYETITPKYVQTGKTIENLPGADVMTYPNNAKAFDGWYTQPNGQGTPVNSTVAITTGLDGVTAAATGYELTLYPHWTDMVTVTYHHNGLPSSITMPEPTVGLPNATFTVPTIDFNGATYTLKEWVTRPDDEGNIVHYTPDDNAATLPNKSIDVYAVWDYTGDNKVAVKFNGNDTAQKKATLTPNDNTDNSDATKNNVYTMYREPNTDITPGEMPIAVRDAYVFSHWDKNATASKLADDATQPNIRVETQAEGAPMNVYAIWTADPDETPQPITITFVVNGTNTTPASIDPIVIAYGDSLGSQMPTITRTDFTFDGWYTDVNDASTKKLANSEFTEDTILTAKWVEDVTIKYDINGGTGAVADQKKPAADPYLDPATSPTREGYKLVGWNTKVNGAGEYIESGNKEDGTPLTFQEVADKIALVKANPTDDNVLYAQWAVVDDGDEPKVKDDDPVDPSTNGVRVIFNDNVPTGDTKLQTSATPKYKYLKLDQEIAARDISDSPVRTDYKCIGWNTKPDGTGKTIAVGKFVKNDADNFDGAITALDDPATKYEVNLYAQWELADDYDGDRVTVIFNKNSDGTGADADKIIEKTIAKGDALGFDVAAPTSETSIFQTWAKGSVVDGLVQFETPIATYQKDESIDENTTYYAKWTTYVALYLHDTSEAADKFDYTGEEIKPTFDAYYVQYQPGSTTEYDKVGDPINGTTPIDPSDASSQFAVQYQNTSGATVPFKDADIYTLVPVLKPTSELAQKGALMAGANPTNLTIKEAELRVTVDPDTQERKGGPSAEPATVNVTGMKGTDQAADAYSIKYYKWTPSADDDTTIDDGELAEVTDLANLKDPANGIGKYVIKVVPTNNYIVANVASTSDQNVVYYTREKTDKYPGYPSIYEEDTENAGQYKLKVNGQNIVFEVVANDPSAGQFDVSVIHTDDSTDPATTREEAATLKDSTYKTDKTFDTSEESTDNDYYIIAAKDVTDVKIAVQPKNESTTVAMAVQGGDSVTPDKTTNAETQKSTYTGTLPVNETGLTVIEVTMTAADGVTQKIYTITVKKSVAGITLNYGNSPYGEIMKTDWTDEQKTAAKAAFDVANRYGNGSDGTLLIPPQAADKTQLYHMRAWVDIAANNITSLDSLTEDEQNKLADPNVNMDRNETAIFIYNGDAFVDPGFVAVDAYGDPVTNLNRTIKVRRITGQTNWQLIADDRLQAEETIEILNQPSNALITNVTKPVALDAQNKIIQDTAPIRPDIYEMTYSFEDEYDGVIEVKRKVVVLQPEGDANFSDTFNDNDFIPINAWMLDSSQFSTLITTDTARRIYLYKTLDINYTETINDNDFIPLNSYMLDSSRVIPSSYVKLPSTLPGNN